LVASGINPDVVTFAALSLGVDVLAMNLGIEEVGKAKRSIGFGSAQELR
jgi:hypothetical protein